MDEPEMRHPREIGDENVSTLPLRVDRVRDSTSGFGQTLYCTGADGIELRVTVDGVSDANRSWKTNQWYSFENVVQSRTHGTELLLPSEDGGAERIDTPEHRTHSSPVESEDPWLIQLGASDEVLGVTVQLRPTDAISGVRADDPASFEVGAVCLAPCGGSAEATIYHREEPDARDEQLLLQHVASDLSERKEATLVTRGVTRLPLEMLQARLDRAAGGDIVDAGAAQVLDGYFHANLSRVAARRNLDTLRSAAERLNIERSPVSLDDYDIGLDPVDWREGWKIDDSSLSSDSDPRMTDRDYATLVEQYLGTDEESHRTAELARCLKAYVRADWSLLCAVVASDAVDKLACSRLATRLYQ
jgi:hypothetical protein